ncbi:MAG: flagellar M-ring protein FliF [Desulfobulbus sp.]|nr:flagellar M-ring protein FliF [Desulfobulbus sp.]
MAEQPTDATSISRLKSGWQALAATIVAWPLPRKIALAAVAALTLGLFALIIVQSRTTDYQLLYGNLADADASAVINWLKSQNIPYQLENSGHNVLIPIKDVHETRLTLASLGLPQGGGVGFEIFDKQSFALTDFVQKVNYSRALQGELSRTIASLGPVETARVHLALPEKRLFKEQQQPATASVIIKLAPGKRLSEPQIEGIVHLVSSSIEGLAPQHVTVIDQNGNVLSRLAEKGMAGSLSPDMLEFQMQVEQRLEDRAQALLDKSLGAKNAMVRVSATLNFAKTEKTEETFDPEEPVIRSEQVNEDKSGSDIVGGIPGVQSNLEGNAAQSTSTTPPTSRSQRTTNYEISKVVSKTINPVGTVSKLSVSVLVADKAVPAKDGEAAKTEPRSQAELKALETMIASALGLNPARGDKIEVTSMPFLGAAEDADSGDGAGSQLYPYMPLIRYGLFALGALLLYFVLIRPLMKTLNRDITHHYKTVEQMSAEQTQGWAEGSTPGTADVLIGGAAYKTAMESPAIDTMERIRKGVENDPVFSAHVLKGWIHEQS